MGKAKFITGLLLCSFFVSQIFADTKQNSLQVKFIKGNISDKTAAVHSATGESASLLSRQALSFVIENYPVLNNDRDLTALAIAGILAIPDDYVTSLPTPQKNTLISELAEIFNSFHDSNVKIAVVGKTSQFSDVATAKKLTSVFNDYISQNYKSIDESVAHQIVQSMSTLADEHTLNILYNLYLENYFPNLSTHIENTISVIVPKLGYDFLNNILNSSDEKKIQPIFNIIEKKVENNENFKAEFAENVLSATIYNIGNRNQNVLSLQRDALNVLSEKNWTRASSTVIAFFDIAVKEYNSKQLAEDDFIDVVKATAKLAPIESAQKLSSYLSDLNSTKEFNTAPSNKVVRAVVSTLGSLGNKQAFDALLAVTYLDYPDDIVTLARDSLARLRW